MIPPAFDYARPASVEEAVRALADGGEDAKVLAGGQSLLPLLRMRLAFPELVVDVGRVPGLSGVREDGDTLVIGAMTTHHDVIHDPLVRRHAGLLAATLRAERLPVRTPSVVDSDAVRGLVVTAALPGCGLGELLAGPRAVEACRSVGRLLAEIHRLPGEDLPAHGPDEELAVLDRWATWASDWRVAPAYPLVRLPAAPANDPPTSPVTRAAPARVANRVGPT